MLLFNSNYTLNVFRPEDQRALTSGGFGGLKITRSASTDSSRPGGLKIRRSASTDSSRPGGLKITRSASTDSSRPGGLKITRSASTDSSRPGGLKIRRSASNDFTCHRDRHLEIGCIGIAILISVLMIIVY